MMDGLEHQEERLIQAAADPVCEYTKTRSKSKGARAHFQKQERTQNRTKPGV
jgi:hypothetical protein